MSGDSLYLATALCETIAAAVAPQVVHDLPASIISDGARCTWASYSRTPLRVAVEHRTSTDLLDAPAPAMLLHGGQHRSAPVRMEENLAARTAELRRRVRLETLNGGDYLDVRQLRVVGAALDRELATGVTP